MLVLKWFSVPVHKIAATNMLLYKSETVIVRSIFLYGRGCPSRYRNYFFISSSNDKEQPELLPGIYLGFEEVPPDAALSAAVGAALLVPVLKASATLLPAGETRR